MLYNVFVLAAQQSESALCIHMSPAFSISFPFKFPQSTESSSLCCAVDSHELPVLYMLSVVLTCILNPILPISFPPFVKLFRAEMCHFSRVFPFIYRPLSPIYTAPDSLPHTCMPLPLFRISLVKLGFLSHHLIDPVLDEVINSLLVVK